MLVPAFSPCTSQRRNQSNCRLAIARAFPLDTLLHKSRRRSIPTSLTVRQRKAAAGFLNRHCDLPRLAAGRAGGALRSSRPTMTGARGGIQISLVERRQAGVVGAAAAQRLCKVGFQSGFMAAAAASSESHERVGVQTRLEGGLAGRRTVLVMRNPLARARSAWGHGELSPRDAALKRPCQE